MRGNGTCATMQYTCEACGGKYTNFTAHCNAHPACLPPELIEAEYSSDDEDYKDMPSLREIADTFDHDALQDQVANDLSDLRFEHGLDGPGIDFVKVAVNRWDAEADTTRLARLRALVPHNVTTQQLKDALCVKKFDQLSTQKQELAFMRRRDVPSLEPRVVDVGDSEHVVSFDLGDLITRKLQHDKHYREQCIEKSEEWKLGEHWNKEPDGEIANFDDGVVARFHPHLMRPATDDELIDLRVAINLNADDIEVCNPLGTARGDHKECGVQCGTLNLKAEDRFCEDNILLPVLAKAKVYKVHGMARVLAGVDHDGIMHDEPNFAKDMRELAVGRLIKIPDNSGTSTDGYITVRLKVYIMLFSGDYLGAQSLLPTSESPGAHVFCRGCDYDARSSAAGRPFSFLRAPRACGATKAQKASFSERTWPSLQAELANLRAGVTATELKKKYHDLGLNKLYFALDPEYIPHIDPCIVAPQDCLHLFPDGLLRSELAWLTYILCKMGLDLNKLNARIKSYKDLPKDVRIPPFPKKVTKGKTGGVPVSKSVARMTGSQCMHFSLHSFYILDPLLTDEMRAHPAWASWLKLVELFSRICQHELHVDDVDRTDALQLEYSRLFDLVPEYNGLKRPKHHFLSHLPLDLWRYGPARGYWCFGYEHFNQIIKRGANQSNWKNTTLSVMKYWSYRSARHLERLEI